MTVALTLEVPLLVRSLVLGSGYYYPTLRADTFLLSPPAIPVIGDAMRYTVSPLVARAILPGMIKRVECDSLDKAEHEAACAAAEIGRDRLPKGDAREITVEVKNEHRQRVLTITVSMHVDRVEPPPPRTREKVVREFPISPFMEWSVSTGINATVGLFFEGAEVGSDLAFHD